MKIHQFQEIYKIVKSEEDEIIRLCKTVAVLHGGTHEKYLEMTPRELLKYNVSFSAPEGKAKNSVRIGKRKFFSSTLVSEINAAEFIDLTEFTKSEEDIILNLHNILAVFYKDTSWFKKLDRAKTGELFLKEMDAEVAYPLAVFFCNLSVAFSKTMIHSLRKQEARLVKKQRKTLRDLLG
jgi:hypothetical protein